MIWRCITNYDQDTLIFTAIWANSAADKLVIFFYFSENLICNLMQSDKVSLLETICKRCKFLNGDNLHEISNPRSKVSRTIRKKCKILNEDNLHEISNPVL